MKPSPCKQPGHTIDDLKFLDEGGKEVTRGDYETDLMLSGGPMGTDHITMICKKCRDEGLKIPIDGLPVEPRKQHFVFQIEVKANEDWSESEVSIGGPEDTQVSLPALVVCTEHMMTLVALESQATFDKAIDLLVKGAKSNKPLEWRGKKVQ